MAIKSKKFHKGFWLRLAAVFCSLAAVALATFCLEKNDYLQYVGRNVEDYTPEGYFINHPAVRDQWNQYGYLLYELWSTVGLDPDTIQKGDFPRWNDHLAQLNAQRQNDLENVKNEYRGAADDDPGYLEAIDRVNRNYDTQLSVEKPQYILDAQRSYERGMEKLKSYSLDGALVFATTAAKPLPGSVAFDANQYYFQLYPYQIPDRQQGSLYRGADWQAVDASYQNAAQDQRQANWVLAALIGACVLFVAGIVCFAVAGGTKVAGEIVFHWQDKPYLEFLLLPVAGMLFACILQYNSLYVLYWYGYGYRTQGIRSWYQYALTVLCLLGFWWAVVWFITSLVKRVRSGGWWRHTLVYQLLRPFRALGRWLCSTCRLFWRSRQLSARLSAGVFLLVLLLPALVLGLLFLFGALFHSTVAAWAGGIIGFVLFGFILVRLTSRFSAAFTALAAGVETVKNGTLNEKIPPTKWRDIDKVADGVNHIADGLRGAVEEELAARRMKVELITNVSHDLKTPLTSIISYVDLLSKEELPEGPASEYVAVLQEKSERLRMLIENLFEISKAESGSISVNPERLCLNDLLRQALAEYEARFAELDLQSRVTLPEEKLWVFADSTVLWRVFSNLLGNVVKYAMPGTRVYLDAVADGDSATVTIKNLSNYEMVFSAGDITQRFVRGDASRTGEGSGLGLSIVDSFLHLMDGRFQVVVDGDLFKAIVALPLYRAAGQEPPAR